MGQSLFSDEVFGAVSTEWSAVLERAAHEARVQHRVALRRWEEELGRVSREYRDLLLRGRWASGPSDFFGVLGLTRSEVYHSALIAWLLDPTGRHGLGHRFFEELLLRCRWAQSVAPSSVHRVACEVTRGDTRADIVVWADRYTIVIENKVDAVEGDHQCDRLYDRFSSEPNPRFVLLSPSGRRPRSASGDAVDAFAALSYRDLLAALTKALGTAPSRPDPGRLVAENYRLTLLGEFQ